jgi:hypothetical protein
MTQRPTTTPSLVHVVHQPPNKQHNLNQTTPFSPFPMPEKQKTAQRAHINFASGTISKDALRP